MARSFIRVAPDSTGKSVSTRAFLDAGTEVHRGEYVIADPDTLDRAAAVSLRVTGDEPGLVARTIDAYQAGEVLADQTGANAVLTFTFAAPRYQIWVLSRGGNARVDPFGGVPSAILGIPCQDGVAMPVQLRATTIRVWAPTGAAVNAWGFSY